MVNAPDDGVLAWAGSAVGAERAARVVRRLAGGSHADTHLLETGAGRAVLRRFPVGDGAAANEARTLTALDGLDGLAPRLLAADPDGARTGRPATLINVLPGRPDILHADPGAAAARLGRALARLHAVPTGALTGFPAGTISRWTSWCSGCASTGRRTHAEDREPSGAACYLRPSRLRRQSRPSSTKCGCSSGTVSLPARPSSAASRRDRRSR
ncbi:phosphotransferase [Actinomadura sp. LD22]|uniref:Phosphotransferase n=1 Tax=Actinomadura physcomitrii TaxID=2650748 RepID=A0A6I4MA54_9ACTN|nr:phosphotransferase [Actinomadura physcomitrii]